MRGVRRGLTNKVRKLVLGQSLSDPVERYLFCFSSEVREDRRYLRDVLEISDDYDDYWFFRKYYDPNLPPITRLQVLDFHTYLPEMNLTKVDRTSMSCSLEVRVPLLSKAMIEAAFELPESMTVF